MILRIYWTILVIFFTAFMVYYNATGPMVVDDVDKGRSTVKKIVAYSLFKQIELDGEEYFCQKKFENISFGKYRGGFWNKVDNSELYVTSVTLDKRLEPYYYLRIIGVVKGSWNDSTTFCQILTNDGNLRIIKSTVTPIWYEKWDMNDNNTYYNPTLLSCRLPILEPHVTLKAVALSPDPCALPTNFHKITRPVSKKVNFTVCVKPLNFKKDISTHLVQWIEICKILGAQYFHIFLGNVNKSTRKLLEWYQLQFPDMFYIEDFEPVEIGCQNCLSNSYFYKTWQRRRYEIVTYNKCFNKNINSKFIIPLDIDELIVPKTVATWQDLLNKSDNNYSSYIVPNVYFFTRHHHQVRYNRPFFLSENRRIKLPNEKGENGKSFIQTKNSLTVFNHYALHSLQPGVIKDYFLPFRDVQLNHYKESCNHVIFPECNQYLSSPTITDNVIYKYRNEFNEKYNVIVNRLKEEQIKIF